MMLDVARHAGAGKLVSLAVVSRHTGISRGYLDQLATAMRNARLLRAASGRHGGYRLARPATEITMFEIIEAATGPLGVVDCIDDPAGCPRTEYCECRVVYALVDRRIAEVLKEYSLADLLEPDWVSSHSDTLAKSALAGVPLADRGSGYCGLGDCPARPEPESKN